MYNVKFLFVLFFGILFFACQSESVSKEVGQLEKTMRHYKP